MAIINHYKHSDSPYFSSIKKWVFVGDDTGSVAINTQLTRINTYLQGLKAGMGKDNLDPPIVRDGDLIQIYSPNASSGTDVLTEERIATVNASGDLTGSTIGTA